MGWSTKALDIGTRLNIYRQNHAYYIYTCAIAVQYCIIFTYVLHVHTHVTCTHAHVYVHTHMYTPPHTHTYICTLYIVMGHPQTSGGFQLTVSEVEDEPLTIRSVT